ncbi:MAG: Mov34/MPN/PAD-1 family protein [Gemmataceae bacterium]
MKSELGGPSSAAIRRARTISVKTLWRRWAGEAVEFYRRATKPPQTPRPILPASTPKAPRPVERLRLTAEVSRTLFDEYAAHRAGDRGEEETGWVLLGLRDGPEAVALATLPAGAERHAGQAHVRFNSTAQALGSRIVRQADRRLTMLGVVHTHPGSLRHPSDGDFRGDSQWVGHLRGGEGVFGIGTADAKPGPTPGVGWQPQPHRQCLEKLCFSWYALAEGDRAYRPVSVEVALGPDLALPLRPVWDQVEAHAERLDRLARQQAKVSFAAVQGRHGPALAATVPLAENGEAVQVLLEGKEVRYYLVRGGELFAADLGEARVDQGFYLLMAELAARD